MILKQLLTGIEYQVLQGDAGVEIAGVAYDSRKVQDGFLFVCMRGMAVDGHTFAKAAVEAGAIALVV